MYAEAVHIKKGTMPLKKKKIRGTPTYYSNQAPDLPADCNFKNCSCYIKARTIYEYYF